MRRTTCLPKMEDLIIGRVYHIHSRNLGYAIWNGSNGFIGIRTKFGDRFLDTEYHWDFCQHHGTVSHARDIGIDLPKDILLQERLGLWDKKTDRFVENVNDENGEHLHGDPSDSWLYQYVDTKEQITVPYSEQRIYWKGNDKLLKFLKNIEETRNEDEDYEITLKERREDYEQYEKRLEAEVENSDNIVKGED